MIVSATREDLNRLADVLCQGKIQVTGIDAESGIALSVDAVSWLPDLTLTLRPEVFAHTSEIRLKLEALGVSASWLNNAFAEVFNWTASIFDCDLARAIADASDGVITREASDCLAVDLKTVWSRFGMPGTLTVNQVILASDSVHFDGQLR